MGRHRAPPSTMPHFLLTLPPCLLSWTHHYVSIVSHSKRIMHNPQPPPSSPPRHQTALLTLTMVAPLISCHVLLPLPSQHGFVALTFMFVTWHPIHRQQILHRQLPQSLSLNQAMSLSFLRGIGYSLLLPPTLINLDNINLSLMSSSLHRQSLLPWPLCMLTCHKTKTYPSSFP